ncbi:MAG: helix-turn-helix transcriptional regulator [Deltaproteobacteria bacterium]|jgi:antitoxin component HigA of HigAB toxin-antitoxin module|nr:helix-turn-helix transcriptional regulator [Deltaproteobacteria bacterium]MBT4267225.1 helix-turn-helix transcriptional regulator [Deltaproteobacteria bacterium]MBT4642589.1 helix-turn-helix transcriptional regulator [Deltaproteobacteria bacterium]MBT6503067.1 helix-turn-helix transcriptional regulator [Deltaproteobacteria bacterium]MBT6612617.1 helix-turn-helix transcriptional regulator [Deltaproteobacteria bacterium]
MLAVVRKPHTKIPVFEVRGEIPEELLNYIKKEMKYTVDIDDDDGDEYVDITETDWYKERKANRSPGQAVRVYRDNFGFTQAKLGEKLGGLSRQNVSDMENNRRGISKDIAKKLSKIFKVPVDRFI